MAVSSASRAQLGWAPSVRRMLADDLEEAARAESMRRAQETARSSRAKLRLPALDRGGLSRGRHAACPGGNEDLHYTGNAQSGANR